MARIILTGALLFATITPLPGAPPAPRDVGEQTSPTVTQALEKELAGDNAGRQSLLRQQVAETPDDSAAHWHLGEIRVDNAWIPHDRVADNGDRWRELYRYSEERRTRKNTVDDQLYLADGARSHGLFDQERAHLTQVVTLDPAHVEAHQRLGDVFAEGTWIRRETFDRMVSSQRRWGESLVRHGKEAERFTARMRRLSEAKQRAAREEWQAWNSPERIPALERAIGDRGDTLQLEYIRWLGGFPCYEASRALVRQTLFSEKESVRLEATELLKRRPWGDFLGELVSSVTVVRNSGDPVLNGPLNGHAVSVTWETIDSVVDTQWLVRHPIDAMYITAVGSHVDLHRDAGRAAAAVWQAIRQTRADADSARNERAIRTVSRVVGRTFSRASEVWEWWDEAEDVLRAQERISRNYNDSWYIDARRRTIQPSKVPFYQFARVQALIEPQVLRLSCLAAGTPIVTETGVRPIESIEIGDRVLAQDLETGELAFKPVFARTTREKAKLYRLKTASDEIVCSQGHPFWANAIGWVQARSLKPGMRLHTTSGTTEVVSIEPAGEGTVYNVVAADMHTYFVGKTRAFLSHDVTPRQATNALVPGLQPIWMAPEQPAEDHPVTVR